MSVPLSILMCFMCLYPYLYLYLLFRCACADVHFTLPICIHPYVICCHLQCLWAFLAFPTPLHCKLVLTSQSHRPLHLGAFDRFMEFSSITLKKKFFPETVKLVSDMDFPELPPSCPFKLETTPNAGRIVVATRYIVHISLTA